MEQLLQLYQKVVEMDKRFTALGLNLADTHKIISEHETLEQRVKVRRKNNSEKYCAGLNIGSEILP